MPTTVYCLNPLVFYTSGTDLLATLSGQRISISDQILRVFDALPNEFSKRQFFKVALQNELPAEDAFNECLEKSLLVENTSQPFKKFHLRSADIEICSHCNLRCSFCPVSLDPLPAHFMSDGDFETIIKKLAPYRLEWITLNHYNEPLLDKGFLNKLKILKNYRQKLLLFTNGVLLNAKVADALVEFGRYQVVINIPTIENDKYKSITGIPLAQNLKGNIVSAISKGLKTKISVNGTIEEAKREKKKILEYFGDGVDVFVNITHDRAGIHKNGTIGTGTWTQKLGGCSRILQILHVGVGGEIFLCYHDYKKEHILGNILKSSVQEVMESVVATSLRKQIFGVEDPSGLICNKCISLNKFGNLQTGPSGTKCEGSDSTSWLVEGGMGAVSEDLLKASCWKL